MIKKPEEIQAIEKACQLGDKTFNYILKKIKPGVTEKQLAFEIKFFIKKHGGGTSFRPIVAFGANSSTPHHKTTHNSKLKTHNLILLDFGVKLDSYCSDMTRVVFLGKATEEQRKVYQTVLEAQKLVIKHLVKLVNLIKAKEVDRVARDYIIKAGFPTMPHGLGHGIGLKVHEPPRLSPKSKDILKPGMVFSIEPGIYLPGKFGVRIEDLVVLEKSGPRILTKSPREIIELKNLERK